MFKNMDGLYTEISEFFSFDKQKYTIEEFFGDIKTFKDDFVVRDVAAGRCIASAFVSLSFSTSLGIPFRISFRSKLRGKS